MERRARKPGARSLEDPGTSYEADTKTRTSKRGAARSVSYTQESAAEHFVFLVNSFGDSADLLIRN